MVTRTIRIGDIKGDYSLRELREQQGLSLKMLGSRMGRSASTVARIESLTNMKIPTLRRYVEALGGSLDFQFVKKE